MIPALCSHKPPKLVCTRKINLNMNNLIPMKNRVPIIEKITIGIPSRQIKHYLIKQPSKNGAKSN